MVRFARREEHFYRTLGKQWTAKLDKVYHARQAVQGKHPRPLLMGCPAAPPHGGFSQRGMYRFF
jgi:hypothetical protein